MKLKKLQKMPYLKSNPPTPLSLSSLLIHKIDKEREEEINYFDCDSILISFNYLKHKCV